MKDYSNLAIFGVIASSIFLGGDVLLYLNDIQYLLADGLLFSSLLVCSGYLLMQVKHSKNQSLSGGSFIQKSTAFHAQLGNEISDQLNSANTELGNTQVILNDAITKLVSNFIVISDEVRNLSGNAENFSKQMHELVNDVTKSLRLAERFLDGLASNDPVVVRESEAHIHAMIDIIASLNETVTKNAVELNLTSAKVEQNVLVVISTLQFQDMSSQLIEHARMRMQALQEVANEMAKQGDNTNNREYLERIAAYNRLLDKHVVSLDKQKANPVTQKDYTSGDIELF